MAITAAGVGSGLDIENIISSLMQIERRPLDLLQQREAEYRAELSAYGQLKSAIASFQEAMEGLGSIDKFKVFGATSSDEDVATVTADSDAAQGIFDLEVTRLAQNHKQATAFVAETDTFDGTLAVETGADAVGAPPAWSIDLGGMTLDEIVEAINTDPDNPGVTATTLNQGDGTQALVLTADESGYANRLAVSHTPDTSAALGFSTINRDAAGDPMADLTELDAAFTVDGFAMTRSSNTVGDVMSGITMEFKQLGTSTMKVDRDTTAIEESVQGFVDAYNALYDTIDSLGAGELSGDSTLRSLQSQLRGVINTPPAGLNTALTHLGEVGIATGRDGRLSLDSSDLQDTLSADFSGVAELFAQDDQGYAFRFAALADTLLDSDGMIDTREDGLNDRIRDNENRQLNVEYQLELKETHLRAQYAALDSLVGQLQQTSTFLYQQLGA